MKVYGLVSKLVVIIGKVWVFIEGLMLMLIHFPFPCQKSICAKNQYYFFWLRSAVIK
jgi:hypothetical protein